jgi:hypothetical protein
MKVPNRFRIRKTELGTSDAEGNNGAFLIPLDDERQMLAIVSDGLEIEAPNQWEHVSVSIRLPNGKTETPSWADMCKAKDIFWDKEDLVVQFHPPKSAYVNNHPHVLHLWRAVNYRQPTPPRWMV